jgi:hypothetical protein
MIELISDELGTLELRGSPFVVDSFEIGPRAERPVMRDRALSNGGVDNTLYVGGRAMTITVRIDDKNCQPGVNMQTLLDQLMPYTVANRFLTITWTLPGSEARRKLRVRALGAPVPIVRKSHPLLICSFVSADGEVTDADGGSNDDGLLCASLRPSADSEPGRTYNLTFNRTYPPAAGQGARILVVGGNERANWTARLDGPVNGPSLRVNGITISWPTLNLTVGHSLHISTRDTTMLYDNDPLQPRYGISNFADWVWGDLLLYPGENEIRFSGADIDLTQTDVEFCWENTWSV